MNVSLGLLDYLPLAQQPFDKVSTEKQRIVEESYKAIDKRADEFRNESIYAYHPHNQNKIPSGQIVNFIVT
tara:strand:+ start:128 stop:340 length:213 start_codon:yes stop_codon:yes gene_type:complete